MQAVDILACWVGMESPGLVAAMVHWLGEGIDTLTVAVGDPELVAAVEEGILGVDDGKELVAADDIPWLETAVDVVGVVVEEGELELAAAPAPAILRA